MARAREREQRARRPQRRGVREDRLERGHAEDDRRDERDLVRLEEVGRHAGAVADVVADVVGDRGRVARIVLGDTGFHLAHEIGTDVGRLGEDAAADAQEQCEQRTTESEAHEDRGARVLERDHDQRRAEEAEADREHAGDAAGAERNLQRGGHRTALRGRSRPHVAPHREAHADEAGESRHEAAEDERAGAEQARLRVRQRDVDVSVRESQSVGLHLGRGEEHDDRERHEDHRDGLELPAQVGHRALLDRLGDLFHLLGAFVGREHASHQEEADEEGEQRGRDRAQQDRPLTAVEVEGLVAAFGGQYVRHFCSSPGLGGLLDVNLIRDSCAECAVFAVDPEDERTVEGMLLLHLHAHARP